MVKKMSKYGNSLAVLIDKPILELLNIDENTRLKIRTDGKNIIIQPLRAGEDDIDPELKKSYKDLEDKYQELFKKLAD